jgi:putative ABC transport system permease protein
MKLSLISKFYIKQINLFSFPSLRFIFAISIGVGSVIGINSYRNSLQGKIVSESKNLMGADLQLESPRKLTQENKEWIIENLPTDSKIFDTIQFPSMISNESGDESSLSLIKGIENGFPFYGEIITEPKNLSQSLSENQILLDKNLAKNLKLKINDTVLLGETKLVYIGDIIREPSTVGSFISMAPSSIVNINVIPKTGLEIRGSRIRYNTFILLPKEINSKEFKEINFSKFSNNDFTLYHNTEIGSGSQKFINSTMDYMSLLGLSSFFLGAISTLITVKTRIASKTNDIAVLKCLGAKSFFSVKLFGIEIIILSFIGSLLGILSGYGIQFFIPDLTGSEALLDIKPSINERSLIWGIAIGLIIPLILTLDSLYSVFKQSPLSAIRNVTDDSLNLKFKINFLTILQIFILYLSFFLLAWVETNDPFKGLIFSGILILLPLVLYTIYILFRYIGLNIAKHNLVSGSIKLTLSKISRTGSGLSLSIIGIGSAITILLISIFLRESLIQLSGWNTNDTRANMFIMDLKKEQVELAKEISIKYEAKEMIFSPIIGARLNAINGNLIEKANVDKDPLKRDWKSTAKTREYFLTYRDQLYDTEYTIDGNFWNDSSQISEISIEKDFAKALGVKVNDELTFNVQGKMVKGKITNLRFVNWADMKPNFVVIFNSFGLSKAPGYFISSLYIEDGNNRYNFQKELVRLYPNTIVIDIEKTLVGLNAIVIKITDIINLMTMFIFSSSILLLFSSLYLQEKERNQETTLYKIVGANSNFIRRMYTYEAFLISNYSFLVALVFSLISNYLISSYVLNINFNIPLLLIIYVFVGCFTIIWLVYMITNLSIINKSPKHFMSNN